VNVEDKVIRVWRTWLEERAQAARAGDAACKHTQQDETTMTDANLTPTCAAAVTDKESTPIENSDISTSPSILWTDHQHNLGLLVGIKDHKHAAPLLTPFSSVEDQPASYSIEIKGKYTMP
jgi:hypothetical protein